MLKRFLKDERGLETIEWVVMAAVIIIGIVALAELFIEDHVGPGLDRIGAEIDQAGVQTP